MKVVLQYRASPGFRAQIDAIFGPGGVTIVDEDDLETFGREIADASALLHVLKPVTAQLMAGAPKLGLVQKLGVGVNTIDLVAAKARGVAVANMPGANSAAVAEMALCLMLAVLRRTLYLDALTRAGEGWRPDPTVIDQTGEIGGRTVGLVGFGASAARLAPVLAALGARVVYTARSPRPQAPYAFLSLDELLARSDIVSLHLPLTEATSGLIGERAIAVMKAGSILINTARGELVDEVALAGAVARGRLRGAGLDVFANEPVGADNPLFALPNVVLSPHQAWLTPETLARSLAVAHENCRRLAAGETLLHRVC
jgi:phosphoglycerate dehydrogenase-like enzyme